MKAQKETLVFFHAGNGRSRRKKTRPFRPPEADPRGAARSLPQNRKHTIRCLTVIGTD